MPIKISHKNREKRHVKNASVAISLDHIQTLWLVFEKIKGKKYNLEKRNGTREREYILLQY